MIGHMSDPDKTPSEAPPRRKPGPPKGTRPAGRRKGSKNKATLEREARAAADLAKVAELERLAAGAKDDVQRAAITGQRLMKDIAFDFASLFAGLAAYYQPWPDWVRDENGALRNANPNFNEAKFKEYGVLAKDTAIAAAAYQSPRYSAMVVGASVVTKVVIEGGMADDFTAPAPKGEILELKAGMEGVIKAEEEQPPAILPKAVGE
jgi:hypothetical protein